MRIEYLNDHGKMGMTDPFVLQDLGCTLCQRLGETGTIRRVRSVLDVPGIDVTFVDREIGKAASYMDSVEGRPMPKTIRSNGAVEDFRQRRDKRGMPTPLFHVLYRDGGFDEFLFTDLFSSDEQVSRVMEDETWLAARALLRKITNCYLRAQGIPASYRPEVRDRTYPSQGGEFRPNEWVETYTKIRQYTRSRA
jgi:hypothetical protein